MNSEENKLYNRGYKAGLRRSKSVTELNDKAQFRRAVYLAALDSALRDNWNTAGKPHLNIKERCEVADDIARESLKHF